MSSLNMFFYGKLEIIILELSLFYEFSGTVSIKLGKNDFVNWQYIKQMSEMLLHIVKLDNWIKLNLILFFTVRISPLA